jgi:predicted AlkP superfamily phosphohydrolase/phosphomutase
MRIEQWATEGKLPAFARLFERGAYATLESTAAIFSGSPWLSITTGVHPGMTGVYSRYQLATGTYDVRRMKASDIRAEPFWNSFKGPLVIVDVPKAPLNPATDGVQVVEWGAYDHYSELSSKPADLAPKIVSEFGRHPFVEREFEVRIRARRDFDVLRDQLIQGVGMKHRLNLALAERLRPRLFLSVFGEAHAAGHGLWRFDEPRHPRYAPGGPLANALLDVYRAIDSSIGEFFEQLPGDCIFVVLSSHGFCMDSMAREDLVCEMLIRMGMSVSRLNQIDYAPYVPGLTLDMARSRAFCLPTDLQGYIRINLRGREPAGIVAESEYDAICRELESEFLAFRHRDTGAPVVKEVVRVHDLFKGPLADDLPDLSVIWNADHIVEEIESPKCGVIRCAPDLSAGGGNHRGTGFMLVSGPDVGGGRFAGSILDVAPTLCALLGEAPCPEWDGRPLPIPGLDFTRL